MKYLALILFFAATSAFAGDSTSVVWTSDSTYVKNGVEYIDIEKQYFKKVESRFPTQSDKTRYYYWYTREFYFDCNPANPNADLRLMKRSNYLVQGSSKLIA